MNHCDHNKIYTNKNRNGKKHPYPGKPVNNEKEQTSDTHNSSNGSINGYILKIEFSDELDVECKKNRRIKNDVKGVNAQMKEVAID